MSLTNLIGKAVVVGGIFVAGMYFSGNPDSTKTVVEYGKKGRDVAYNMLEPDMNKRINSLYSDLNDDKELLLKNRVELLQLTNYFVKNADKSSLDILKYTINKRLED